MTLLSFAVETVRAAGAVVRTIYEEGPQQINHKSSAFDLVTEADVAAEQLVVSALHRHFPQHGLWSEEGAAARPAADAFWLLDPLDGTTNFAHRFPVFAVSLAFYQDDEAQVGVVLDVMRNRCYWAQRGGGAWCDGRPLHVSSTNNLAQSLLATGFPYSRAVSRDNNLAEFNALMPRCQGVRRAGAAALDLAWVAEGCLDGYWEARLNPWDYGAGVLLVHEAGGRVATYDDRDWRLGETHLIASNGQTSLHQALVTSLASARAQAQLPALHVH